MSVMETFDGICRRCGDEIYTVEWRVIECRECSRCCYCGCSCPKTE